MRPARRANQRFGCQVHHKKIFLFSSTPNHPYILRRPVPVEGRWPSSRTLGRDAVDAAVSGAWSCLQGGLWSVSEHSVQTTGANARRSLSAKTGGCVRQNRVVLAPVAGVKLTEARRPNRVQTILQSVSDGDKTNSSPGRARYKPSKPLRRECRNAPSVPVCSCAFLCTLLHTRPRVQQAPGIPCALLLWANEFTDLGRIAPRDCGVVS